MLKTWNKLPKELQTEEVKEYYDVLRRKRFSLFIKRAFDLFAALLLTVVLSPTIIIIALVVKLTSKGPVFYRQKRITQYGKTFGIYKFRTMVKDADKIGSQITVEKDARITKIGKVLRKLRLDELPQLFNVIAGSMTFIGTRPEVEKYVERYTPEMMATLLLPAGITSEASIYFKNEAELIKDAADVDKIYVERILPEKMYYNLKAIKNFGVLREFGLLFKTVFAVLGKDYKGDYGKS